MVFTPTVHAEEPPPVVLEVYVPECSCINGARVLGVPIPALGKDGGAKDIEGGERPVIGGLALFSYEKLDHVGVIIRWYEEGFIMGEENYEKTDDCDITYRYVRFDDKDLRGFASF